jgi:hypothetical protein
MYRKRSLNMDEKLKKVILDYKSLPNKDLEYGLEKISEDFESTKDLVIKLSLHLDSLEENYNKILKEYKSRN